MRFLVDAQLPPALARWLVGQGHEARHVADIGLSASSDSEIWDRAQADGAVIVTKDEDFALRTMRSRIGPQVVWLRIGNSRRRTLLLWLEPWLPTILEALDRGERLIEVV